MGNDYNELSKEAHKKINELLNCGNERVELAAAKELLSAYSKESGSDNADIHLEVTIKVI